MNREDIKTISDIYELAIKYIASTTSGVGMKDSIIQVLNSEKKLNEFINDKLKSDVKRGDKNKQGV